MLVHLKNEDMVLSQRAGTGLVESGLLSDIVSGSCSRWFQVDTVPETSEVRWGRVGE